MWGREVDGKVLTFRLAGINNQNFLMRDEETGTYWQQISGQAISGPMKGKQLLFIHWDELSFGLWRTESPAGTALLPVAKFQGQYAKKDWERAMAKARTVTDTKATGIGPRELMVGVQIGVSSRAYPITKLISQKLTQDSLGGKPILLVLGPDSKSVRGFTAPGDFYRQDGALMMDAESGSEWNFKGCAIRGPKIGQCLTPIAVIKDYWFDWRNYHPDTSVYR